MPDGTTTRRAAVNGIGLRVGEWRDKSARCLQHPPRELGHEQPKLGRLHPRGGAEADDEAREPEHPRRRPRGADPARDGLGRLFFTPWDVGSWTTKEHGTASPEW
jgi:hypothetical protein